MAPGGTRMFPVGSSTSGQVSATEARRAQHAPQQRISVVKKHAIEALMWRRRSSVGCAGPRTTGLTGDSQGAVDCGSPQRGESKYECVAASD